MDQTTAVVKDAFDRVTKKQKLHHSVSLDIIDLVCDTIQDTLSRIQLGNNVGLEPESVLAKLRQKLDALLPTIQLKRSQKETKLSLDKLVKTFESFYHPDISLACRSIGFDIPLVNKILIQHCYREGLFEVGDCLVKEAGEEEETEVRSQSFEIKQIVESMKLRRNIEPAMRWISANRGKLKEKSSEMEFKLVSLKYCDMLREGNRDDAMKYARTHLTRYCSGHLREIQKLVTCQIWIGKLDKCPYAEMVSPSSWDKVTKELISEYYHLLDQPSRSPLTVALSAGLESLPTLLKLVDVMALKKEEWEEMKQLPVPLELGNELQFHSVFVCPVSRDESSKENPPMMMMPCRHVICKQSVIRLSKNCASRRFKCPYCSAQTSSPACRQLFF